MPVRKIQLIHIAYFSLGSLEALYSIFLLLALPSEVGARVLGNYSLPRLIMGLALFCVLFSCVFLTYQSWHHITWLTERVENLSRHTVSRWVILFLAFFVWLIGTVLSLISPQWFPQFEAYLIRLRPLSLWAALFGLQTIVLLILIYGSPFRQDMRQFRKTPFGSVCINTAHKVGSIAFGLLIAFFIMELVLRVYNPFHFSVRGNQIDLPNDLIHIVENNEIDKLDKQIIVTKNSLGFRGKEPPLIGFDKYLTIIAVGGSTTLCNYLSDGKTWPDNLASYLESHYKLVWVNNAGLDGHSTFGHYILLRDRIVQIKPDLVLFLIGINDVGLNAPNEQYDDVIIRNSRAQSKRNNNILCFSSPNCFIASLANYSEVINLGLNLYRSYQAMQRMKGNINLANIAKWGVGHAPIDLLDPHNTHIVLSEAYIQSVLDEHQQRYIPSYRQRVKALINITRENGIEPVLITQPTLYGAGVDNITGVNLETIQFHGTTNGLLEWRVLQLYNDVLRSFAQSDGVLVIDLAEKMPKSSRYYYDFIHFTNEGAEKAAQIIFDDLNPFILNHDLVFEAQN